MPSVEIPGKITSIEYEIDVNFAFVSLSNGERFVDPPTEIVPSGKSTTIVLATNTVNPATTPAAGYVLSPDFNIGDVVEVYNAGHIMSGVTMQIEMPNLAQIAAQPGSGMTFRKISNDSDPQKAWGRSN